MSPFHRLTTPNWAAWEWAWLFHLPIIIAAGPGSGLNLTSIPAAVNYNWFCLKLLKDKGTSVLIGASLEAITALKILHKVDILSRTWRNMKLHLKAVPHASPCNITLSHPCLNTVFLCDTSPLVSMGQARSYNTFIVCWQTCEVCRSVFFFYSYLKMVFTSVRWNHAVCWVYPDVLLLLKPVHRGHLKADQEEAKFLPFSFLTVEGILQTPSDCEIHLWRDDTPPDGSRLTWFAHYNFAYENKMRCDNWSLMYFSLLSHDTISTALFQGKTLLGRAHLKLL